MENYSKVTKTTRAENQNINQRIQREMQEEKNMILRDDVFGRGLERFRQFSMPNKCWWVGNKRDLN